MIPYSRQWIEEDDIAAVAEVMRGTHLTQGPTIEKFEKALAEYLDVKHVVTVSNGTAALHLAVLALAREDKVRGFVPPITFAATLNCFWYIGAQATLTDVDPITGQMTPDTLEAALAKAVIETPRTAGEKWIVIPVSLQGRPLDYAGLKRVADKYDAILVEDAAHAMGGTYTAENKKHKMGGCGHTFAATTSFHAVKQLSLGEGGAVMTNDDAFAAKIRLLRSHGIVRVPSAERPAWYYEQTALGFNYRITDMQCALGLNQLKKLDARLERRHQLAKRYDRVFSQEPFAESLSFTPNVEGHAYHLYAIHLKSEELRNAAHEFMKTKGFFTQVLYTPLYRFPYHVGKLGAMRLPGAEAYFRGTLAIPLFPKMTDEEQMQVIGALKEFCVGLQKNAAANKDFSTPAGSFKVSVKAVEKPLAAPVQQEAHAGK